MNNLFNICYVTNEDFAKPTLVSIVSLLENNKKPIAINIIYSTLSEGAINKFKSISNVYHNAKVVFHKIDYSRFENLKTHISYITSETYFRYILPEILPNEDKVLYIDGDTIINADISEIFDCDINGYFCAGVRDILVDNDSDYKKLIGVSGLYVNAGVLLFNLNEIRNSNVVQELFDISRKKQLKFQDQDAINIAFNGKIKEIDCIYNFKRTHQKLFPQKVKDAKIIHYVGPNKPWKKFSLNYLKRLFHKYRKIMEKKEVGKC